MIQEVVKISVVRAKVIVAKLVKHSIKNVFIREEIPVSVWPPQSNLNLGTSSNVQTEKRWIGRTAFHKRVNHSHF